ncbi:hypothetical protein B9Z55_026110 [Caenorhabditis nigoni]|uniref:Uncharacterized protein n=1 Tax=Caenorhabditis nigoni TaxID=1611254 RepID=A0A2G5T1A5_9PELO|nr:hypothetical protein B9Z55_026110 [Caenorhabditis nigoni]
MRLWTLLLLFSLHNGLHADGPYHHEMYNDINSAIWTKINDIVEYFSSSNTDQTIPSSTAPPTSTLSEHQQAILSFVNANQELFSKMDQTIPSSTAPPTSTLSEQQQACMSFIIANRELFPKMDQTIPSSSAPPSLNHLDITNQPIPSPTPSEDKLAIIEKENTVQEEHSELDSSTTHQPISSPTSADIETSSSSDRLQEMDNHSNETKASATTNSDSDSNALLSTTSPEHLESTQDSVVEEEKEQKEKEELHKEQSETLTTPIPTPPPTPSIAPIYDPTEKCHSQSTCYVYPQNCSLNCEVVFAWKWPEFNVYVNHFSERGVISFRSRIENDSYSNVLFSCFAYSYLCAYGYEQFDGVLEHGFSKRIYPSSWRTWITINRHDLRFPFGNGRKMEFRLDENRDVDGKFKEMFLKSKE